MFLHKVHSGAQYTLFNRLYDLYEKGIMVILENPSIASYIMDDLYNSLVIYLRLSLSTNHMLISEAAYDGELLRIPLSQYQVLTLQRFTAAALQTTAFDLNSKCTDKLRVN